MFDQVLAMGDESGVTENPTPVIRDKPSTPGGTTAGAEDGREIGKRRIIHYCDL